LYHMALVESSASMQDDVLQDPADKGHAAERSQG
jgi:hypothetical protein